MDKIRAQKWMTVEIWHGANCDINKFLLGEAPRKQVHWLFPLNVQSTTELKGIDSQWHVMAEVDKMVIRFPDV